jgi:hypothetical protein
VCRCHVLRHSRSPTDKSSRFLAVQHDTDDSDEDLDPVPMSARLRCWSAELQVVAPARGYVSAPSSPRAYIAAATRAQVRTLCPDTEASDTVLSTGAERCVAHPLDGIQPGAFSTPDKMGFSARQQCTHGTDCSASVPARRRSGAAAMHRTTQMAPAPGRALPSRCSCCPCATAGCGRRLLPRLVWFLHGRSKSH